MAESRGIDVKRPDDTSLTFTAAPKNSSTGAKITSGTMSLRIFHIVPADGTLEQFDFDDDTFKTGALTTATAGMTHRQTDSGGYDTGMWTYRLDALADFTDGDQYLVQISHTNAIDQERQFQYGGVEGEAAEPGDAMDLITDSVDADAVKTDAVTEIQSGLATSVEVRRNADLIASMLGHGWSGNAYYVDPFNGDDGTGDGSQALPWATVGKAQTSGVTDFNHDIVFLVAGDSDSRTTLDEQLTITKSEWTIIGPGRDFLWTYSSPGNTLTITGAGVHLENFAISTHTTGAGDAIVASQGADDLHVKHVTFEYAREDGIEVSSCDWVRIEDCEFIAVGANAASAGIHVDDGATGSEWAHIERCDIYQSTGDGISLTGSGTAHTIIKGCIVHDSSAWGIAVGALVSQSVIVHNHFSSNASGTIQDNGTETHLMNNEQYAKASDYTGTRAGYIDNLSAGPAALEATLATVDGLVDLALVRLQRNADLIETRRGHHTVQGNVFYVAPVSGDDSTGDGSRALPWKTVTKALADGVVANNHDCIMLVADAAAGKTTLDEQVDVNKAYTMIRGPGRDFLWKSTSDGDVITVTAEGVQLSGFICETHTAGTGVAIKASDANFIHICHIWVRYSRSHGMEINDSNWICVENCSIRQFGVGGTGHGIWLDDGAGVSNWGCIRNNRIHDGPEDGIRVEGASTDYTDIRGNVIHGAGEYGITIGAGVDETVVALNVFSNNTSGNVNDSGTNTGEMNNEQWGKEATLTAMKGAGWSTETLVVIAAFVDELETRLTAARAAKLDNLDTTVGSRSSHTAAAVWAVSTRTLTSFGSLVANVATAVWAAVTRTLTALGSNVINADAVAPSGATEIADATDAVLTSAHGSGSWQSAAGGAGESLVTVTVEDGDSAPLSGVRVYVSADGGTTWTFNATTGTAGEAAFELDDDTYTVWAVRSGYTHTAESLVVSGTTTKTLTMAAFSSGDPAEANLCRVSGRLAEVEAAVAVSGRTIQCELVDVAEGTIYFFDDENSQAVTDANGDWFLDLVWSSEMDDARVRIYSVNAAGRPDRAVDKTILVPDQATAVLSALTAAT